MKSTLLSSFTCRQAPRVVTAAACVVALAAAATASAQSGQSVGQTMPPTSSGGVAATLEQCVTSVVQSERSATFTGEMTAVPGAARMAMRIDVEERLPADAEYHAVVFPGLGVWRSADPKVKVYKYLKQVTNLSSPASYRGLVRFRWISPKGHVIKRTERMTARCLQPASPAQPPATAERTPPTSTATAPGA
jgi:hypothetical protein